MGLKGRDHLSLTPAEKPLMRLCLKATGNQLKVFICTGSGLGRPGIEVWVLPLGSCVILEKLTYPKPQCAHLKNGGNNAYLNELL